MDIKLNDGRRLGYIEYGDPEGKPVFFFHGWPGSRYSGRETDAAAKKLGVRVISTDRPGIGLSTFKKDRTLLDWPDDVVELADFLNIKRFSLMGVSGGGPYVAACAYKIPARIIKAGIVVGLAPVEVKGNLDGMAFFSKLSWANYRRFPFLRTLAGIIAAIEHRYIPVLGRLAIPTKQDRMLFKETAATKEAFRQGIWGPAHELKVYTDDWEFKVKTYLWYGAKDKCVSLNMGRYYHEQIKGSTLFIDPNGGHLARYTYEEKILKLLTS